MKRRSSNFIFAILLVFVTLFGGGLAQAYLAPDYSNPAFAPTGATPFVIGPGVLADYLTNPNWAFTPLLRKFIDPLPGLCNPATDPGHCVGGKKIPIAIPDIVTYPGSDYYVIELQQYSEQMHTDLANPTTLRGYVQTSSGTDMSGGCKDPAINPADPLNCTSANNTVPPGGIHFLGPVIIAQKDRPVRVLFKNKLNPGVDGDLFLPIDTTIMGSGAYDINYNPVTKENTGSVLSGMFSTNRATLHLHGGRSPWISDGTPHQWITPPGEDPNYPQGISVENVPDMPMPAVDSGEQTFYWTNQQSSRFMFYHDHAWGITRLNVYAGEAAGYVIRDNVEQSLTDNGIIPGFKSNGSVSMGGEVPLVLMDKTFVDAATIGATDPTWNWGTGAIAQSGVVTFVNIMEGGSGYTAAPNVTITEGANTSAIATAVLTSVVSTITVDPLNMGLGYVAPLVVIDDPVGVGATAEATIDATGAITGITVTNGGSGYDPLNPPAITIFDQNNDNFTPAVATAAVTATVTAVAVTNGGSGYVNPVVTIDPPAAGTQATASATVTDVKTAKTGDLWWPHVYMPAQNPFDISGVAPLGRWAYGPYFYPATNNLYQPVPNPYYSPLCDPLFATNDTPGFLNGFCQAPEIPSTPNPSWGAEAFMDTAMANGTAYPYVDVEPKAYRLRILNAAHDRFMALSLFQAVNKAGYVNPTAAPYVTTGAPTDLTEVAMIEASPSALAADGTCPSTWPADGRAGGVPACSTKGPDWIMIGNEGGFLPMPVVIPPQPVTWNLNPSMFNVGNINGGSLILGPAERADVIVDFSAYAGKTLIVYNDGSAPWPALNPQYDFYTGNPDGTEYGSAPSTLPGYGPNTRTVMQIRVCDPVADPVNCHAAPATFDLAKLQDAFDPTRSDQGMTGPGVFQQAQDPIIAAQGNMNVGADPLLYETFLGTQDYSAYSRAYGTEGAPAVFPTIYPNWGVSKINDSIIKFKTLNPDGSLNPTVKSIAMKRKSVHDEMGATFDDYGRMRAALGLEMSNGGPLQVNFIVQTYSSPVTENLVPGGTQVWKITHNGVDTHPIHFHLFDVQVLNRVGWDGFIRLPDPTELGWKETVRVSPLEDTIVALRPVTPALPFGVPTSYRPLNPATPLGSTTELTQIDPVTGNPRVTTNVWNNFEWEYVWHCHILSHEENDMMRAITFNVPETLPAAPVLNAVVAAGPQVDLTWTDATPAGNPLTFGNMANEIKFRIDRSVDGGAFTFLKDVIANTTTASDLTLSGGNTFRYTVTAVTAAGEATSNIATVIIPPPAAPSGLTATPVNPIRIDLAWTDNAATESSFELQRASGGCGAGGMSTIATLPANTVAYQDNAVNPGSTFGYRVRATGSGNSAWTPCVPGTTPALAAPSGLAVTGTTESTVTLNWTDNTAVETGFTIQRKSGAVCDATGWATVGTVGANAVSFTNTGLTSNTTFTYRVSANVNAFSSAWSGCATGTTAASAPPAAPSGLTATPLSATSIGIAWTDNSNNETGFQVQTKNGAVCDNANWTALPTVAANTTAFQRNIPNGTYIFRVRAVNGSVFSGWSGCASTATFPAATVRPAAPTGIAAAPGAAGQIQIVWTDNQPNSATASETVFQIQRKNGAVCDNTGWAGVATVPTNATSYTNTGLFSGTTYSYRVRASNAAGPSTWNACGTAVAP